MTTHARASHTNDNNSPSPAQRAAKAWGLGPNQLEWLRKNMDAFRHAEEQRYQARQDTVRAARMAGLVA